MKNLNLFFLAILIVVTLQSFAQKGEDPEYLETTFENDWSFIEFDPPENNIWQVGTPSKPIFNSAQTPPYALMTDTAKLITEPIKHSFILKLKKPDYYRGIPLWEFVCKQKYQFDSLSGGYIEVSYNKGLTWTNTVLDDTLENHWFNTFYTEHDTLANGINGFAGEQTNWVSSEIETYFKCKDNSAGLVYNVWLKFTYLNTGSNNPHEGWMIDRLGFEIDDNPECWVGINDNSGNHLVNIYPNPAINEIFITTDIQLTDESNLALFDINGKLIMEQIDVQFETPINITNLPNGIYFYKIANKQQLYTGKVMVEK